MEISDLYQQRTTPGLRGSILRGLVWWHQKVRPPHPFPGRRQEHRIFQQYVRDGTTILMGSNKPNLTGLGKTVQIDLKALPYVDLVADAEKLSHFFAESSVDFVISQSMLEHTPHPWRVMSETFKVLRPGGVFYLSTPWMFPLHAEPYDYWRFSLPCLQNMASEAGFEIMESGSETSPHGALYSVLRAYFPEALSFGNSYAHYAFEYVFAWLLWPLGLVERLFRLGARKHHYTDSMLFIVTRKPPTPAC